MMERIGLLQSLSLLTTLRRVHSDPSALCPSKTGRRRKSVTTVYQGTCARCERRVRTDENHLKVYLWASTAVFHWSCFIALVKERGEESAGDTVGKASRDTRG
jgi:hypothetical protein